MNNLFDSAKTIQEKREILKSLSKPLQLLVKSEALDSVNEGLKAIYKESGHSESKDFKPMEQRGKTHPKRGTRSLSMG